MFARRQINIKEFIGWAHEMGALRVSVGDISVEFGPPRKIEIVTKDEFDNITNREEKEKALKNRREQLLYASA